ncbi:TetR/AcrR family transcriptional regulator [Nonomuraea africana]|uniref:AcrR family transcriptional regulator n=1 Tax=Nonomuraea africana TaxID=46171 RepID=A0ABR9KJZ1_9ACTN|nr:TetR/AcrR family transcriptional regulator [Nonomuraea africana]MBE1562334.1 AcrR family transcriptional regulator [Nonomuraea africana]
MSTASRTARERVRAELIKEITDIARRHLSTEGAAGLSLRAVAREMGMVSSAIYRYFPTKDDLLTALIVDAYNAVGEAVEEADAGCARDDFTGRWLEMCRAVRAWALAHPHEYALIHGTPVPGYQAPADTVDPASRDGVMFGRLIADAHAAGAITVPQDTPTPEEFQGDAAVLRQAIFAGVPDEVILRGLHAWTWVYGAVSFELFGMYNNVITKRAATFEHGVLSMAHYVGLS